MVQKGFVMLLVLVMLGCACFGAFAEEPPSTALERFLTDWLVLLQAQDMLYSQQNLALEAILRFGESGSWEDLVRARALCAYACKVIDHCASTEIVQTATEEDYALLIAQDMDIGDARAEFRLYNERTREELSAQEAPLWRTCYLAGLMELVYEKDFVAQIIHTAAAKQASNKPELAYWRLVTNYILLELPVQEAAAFTASAEQYAPHVMAQDGELLASTNDVLNAMNDTITEMREALVDYEKALMINMVNLDEAKARVTESGVYDVAAENCQEILDLPPVLPYPSFWDSENSEISYYWRNEAGQVTAIGLGEEIGDIPNCVGVTIPNGQVSQLREYVLELAQRGITPSDMNETAAMFHFDNGAILLLNMGKDGLQLSVRDGQLCFAPDWYACDE